MSEQITPVPPVTVSGSVEITNDSGNPIPVNGTVTITDGSGPITVDGTVAISGTVTVDSELTTADLDTGGGTDTRAVVGLVLAESGGGLLVGSANPLPVSGTVTITDGGGSITVDGTVTANAGTNLNTSALALESGGNLAGAATSLAIIDDWDESDRAKVNIIAGQVGVAGGSGTVSALTQRVVLATDVALPAGTNAIGKLAANDGVDIGDVTINNAAGASAVNIQDGGNSITIDGTVTANAGTGNFTVVNGGTFVVQDSQVVTDNGGFTDGTTKLFVGGFIYDEVAGTALTENDAAAARIDSKRAQIGVIEDGATRGRWATVSAANALKVDGSAVTQPVSGSVTANAGTNLNTSALALESGGNLAGAATSLAIIDDWDESDRAKVNIIVGQAGVAAGAGAVAATVQRMTLASDDPAVTALQIIDDWDESDRAKVNIIAGQVGVAGGSGTVSALTQRVVLATDVGLPAGTNAIGKLAANSGVDIGDVDVTSIIPGSGATNLGKAEDAQHATGDVGVMALGVRNDAAATTFGADGDYTPIAVDANGRVGISDLGGSITVDGTFAAGAYASSATTIQNAVSATGNGTALSVDGFATVTFVVTGTFTALVTFEGSGDGGTTWGSLWVYELGVSGLMEEGVVTGPGTWVANCSGLTHVRGRVTWTSGTSVTVTARPMLVDFDAIGKVQLVNVGLQSIADNVVATGSGAIDAGTQRVVLATDQPAVAISSANLTTLAGAIKNEDTLSANLDPGFPMLATRKATPANVSGSDGDYEFLQISAGRLWASTLVTDVVPGVGATNLGKREDDPHTSLDVGVMALAVRADTSAATAANSDYVPLLTDSRGQLHIAVPKAATSTDVTLASASASAQLLAANTARTGLLLTNTDAYTVYLYYGTTAIATKFSVAIPPGGHWEMPTPIYTGRIDAIWENDGSGSLIGTELAN